MQSKNKAAASGILSRYLNSLYNKKLSILAEHSYCAIICRSEYPYVAEIFEAVVASDISHFKALGELLAYLGVDPGADIRIRPSRGRGEKIDRIIAAALDSQRREMGSVERIHSLTDDPRICEAADSMRAEMSEHIKIFERLLRS